MTCPNCKQEGPHFVPPSFGEEGFYMCKPMTTPLTREQCPLCTANRPRLCDGHYQASADNLLNRVTAALHDRHTPDGVKATYEQLLEMNAALRQTIAKLEQQVATYADQLETRDAYTTMQTTIAQQAQEIDRLKKELFASRCVTRIIEEERGELHMLRHKFNTIEGTSNGTYR